jgi:tetratricopeptide (TPR) repeat protein
LELLKNRGGDSVHGIAATHNFLGELNLKAGRYIEAMEHHTQAFNTIEPSMDTNELDICNTKCYIGVVEYHFGNFKNATNILENACSVQRGLLGNEHSRVAKTMYHLAVIKRIQFDMERATELLNQALRIQLSAIGQHHPDTINTQMEIAKVLLDSNEIDEAITQFELVFQTQQEMIVKDHPDLAKTLYYLGICYATKRDGDDSSSKAMKYLERCYRMQLKLIKFDCPAVASTLDQIGQLMLKQGKLDKALAVLQDSVRIRSEVVGEDHYELAYSLYNMGRIYTAKRNYTDALRSFKDSMRIAVRAFGLEHPFMVIFMLEWGI